MKKEIDPKKLTQNNEEEVQVIKAESKGRKILNTVINVLLVIAIVLAAVCTYVSFVSSSGSGVPSVLGVQMFSIQTESMYPTLKPGDLIFDRAVKDPAELKKGDIITYWTVINGERVLNTHVIHEIYDGGDYLIFATKGLNNNSVDSLTVHESEIVGKYWFRVGGLGKAFDYLQTSTGFLVVVVIPVFIFFLFHLIQFFRVLFEYQNVKNRIKYEQERGRTEDLIAASEAQQAAARKSREELEAELREKLKAEILADMKKQKAAEAQKLPAEEEPAEKPAEEEKPEEQA
ncbi:MAG: signal peptidase I [Oscillospiraceae bacterium]|nr:signal peptidase I [Oscillospiraceae bacterium]